MSFLDFYYASTGGMITVLVGCANANRDAGASHVVSGLSLPLVAIMPDYAGLNEVGA